MRSTWPLVQGCLIGRATSGFRYNAVKTQRPEVQLADEHIDDPDRVLFRHIVIQIFRKQDALPTVLPFDEALHPPAPTLCPREILTQQGVFTQPRSI